MSAGGSRSTMVWVGLALAVPLLLSAGWAAITFGGVRDRLRAEETREGTAILDAAEDHIYVRLFSDAMDPLRVAPRVDITLDARGRPTGPFVASMVDIGLPAAAPERDPIVGLAVDLEAAGGFAASAGLFQRARAESRPGDAWSRLAEIRALAAAGSVDEALARLRATAPAEVEAATGGVPAALVLALLEVRLLAMAGQRVEAVARVDAVLTGAVPVPDAAARAVLDEAAAAGVPVDAPRAATWLAAASVCRELQAGRFVPPLTAARVRDGVVVRVDDSRLAVLPEGELDEAVHTVVTARRTPAGPALVVDDSPDLFVRRSVDRLGITLGVLATSGRASERIESVAHLLLLLAGLAVVAGGAAVVRIARREVALSRLKSTFIDVVSHELRTPLAALSLKAEMLAHGDVPPARASDYARGMHDEVRRLTSLVNRLLDFARLERGRSTLSRQRLDVRALVARVAWETRGIVRAARQRLVLGVPRGLPLIHADCDVLARALRNLIENAGKYAPAGTAVELTAASVSGGLRIEVQDRGPGIPAADLPHLFEPFQRGAGVGGIAGSGLGLALVRQAVREHGGEVRALAREGGGASFVITLPTAAEGG